MEGKSRPILVGIIGLITLIMAFIIIAAAVISLVSSDSLSDIIGVNIGDWAGYSGLIFGLVTLIIGISIWRGWSIAWYIAVILYAIGAIILIYSIISLLLDDAANTAAVIPLAVSFVIVFVILYYLFRPKVKEFFTV